MKSSPIALVETNLETRVEHIEQEYVVEARREYSREDLLAKYQGAIDRIQRRLGGLRYQELSTLLVAAFEDQRPHADWIGYLLEHYYDPMYEYQLENKMPRIAFRGSFAEVREFLTNQNS